MDGRQVEGIDKLTFDEEGRITELKVMIRPASAMQAVGARMAEGSRVSGWPHPPDEDCPLRPPAMEPSRASACRGKARFPLAVSAQSDVSFRGYVVALSAKVAGGEACQISTASGGLSVCGPLQLRSRLVWTQAGQTTPAARSWGRRRRPIANGTATARRRTAQLLNSCGCMRRGSIAVVC